MTAQEIYTALGTEFAYAGVPDTFEFMVDFWFTNTPEGKVHGTNVMVPELSQYLVAKPE